jgi:(methylthio)acryloyl-CoA hydratase
MSRDTDLDLPSSLTAELHDDITVLCLSRPEKRNAIDLEMVRGIDRFFGELPPSTRAVIIRGKGDHFSAGADLRTINDTDSRSGLVGAREWHRAFDRIERSNVPVVAVLQGAVVGGGLELAAAAHIRIAERGTF